MQCGLQRAQRVGRVVAKMAILRWRIDNVAGVEAVSYTHLRAHETVLDLVCRLLLEKKNNVLYLHNKADKKDTGIHTNYQAET